MKKNGFTLIELLAVIVILAIIAVIATPIVLNVIEGARKKAAESEARMVVSGIQSYCAAAQLGDITGNVSADCASASAITTNITKMVDKDASTTVSGLTYANGKVTAITVVSNGYTVKMTAGTWASASK